MYTFFACTTCTCTSILQLIATESQVAQLAGRRVLHGINISNYQYSKDVMCLVQKPPMCHVSYVPHGVPIWPSWFNWPIYPKLRNMSFPLKEVLTKDIWKHPIQHPALIEKGYWLHENIGAGAYGVVMRGKYVRPGSAANDTTLADVAIKIVCKKFLNQSMVNSAIANEATMQLCLGNHENLITLFLCIETEYFVFLPMEYCAYGDVLDRVQKERSLPEDQVALYSLHLTRALAYLHSRGIFNQFT